jgi:hypothetical protein
MSYLFLLNAFGIWGLSTGTTSAGRDAISTSAYFNNGSITFAGFDVAWRFAITSLSSAADNFRAFMGLTDAPGGPTSIIGIEIGNGNNNNIRIAHGTYSAPTYYDTGTTMAINTFHTVRLVMNTAWTSLAVYLDGALITTLSGTFAPISPSLLPCAGIFKTGGTTGTTIQQLLLDAYQERVYAGTR